jgi:undecaprenyl-diphosphatase
LRRSLLWALVAASAVAYITLGVLAHTHPWFAFDLSTTLLFQGWRSAPLDVVMKAVSWPGYFPQFVAFFAAILLVMYRLKLKLEVAVLAAAELGVGAMGFIVKPMVGRLRPSTSLVWVNDRLPADPYTFTAGHVHTLVVIFGFITFLAATRISHWTWARAVLIFGSALILVATGFSRVYLGDHWATDVIGGYLAGGIWLGLGLLAYFELRGRRRTRASAQSSRDARATS